MDVPCTFDILQNDNVSGSLQKSLIVLFNDPGKVAEFSTIKQFQPCRSKLVVKIRAGIRRAIGNLIGTIFQHQTDLRWGQVRGDRKMMLYPVDEIQQDPDAAIHGDAPGRGRFFIAVREEPL